MGELPAPFYGKFGYSVETLSLVVFMRIVAAFLLSLFIESDAVTQTRNIGDADRAGSQQIGVSSCSITASNTPNLPNDQFIRAIIERTVCRGQFVTPEGVHGRTFVPISDRDRASVIDLGVQALGSLTNIADTGDSWAQLIAVRLIANIGSGRSSTFRASARTKGLDADPDGCSL
jgi:hypothetical protein